MKDTVTLHRPMLEGLMADLIGHDRTPAAYVVYLAIWSAGDGGRVALSYADLAARTGLARRTVQTAIAHLHRRQLVAIEPGAPTEVRRYQPLTPWRRWAD
ncbi:helix-turn-helix domain-containing protein [Brevundimonas sp. 2R-24]|uniref:Helix-turn-helix domain-containing protein n=1 Tax=Peiella sedimenti TaxID=3061083 RepID=A0ABT8SQ11_9CAUL|nr:helix-turn-helix domain-containing protein [Caulobacteraceae bacterium XZ-24]